MPVLRCDRRKTADRPANLVHVRTRPGTRTKGVLLAGTRAIPVALGRGGIRADKREGDGGTPRGTFRPLQASAGRIARTGRKVRG
ncbi:MAG: hypothetical protein K8H87_05825, partial [Pseudorhodoplanes sp.]|nr:hypothetical protein [Pseudorhodoplanes sp.]